MKKDLNVSIIQTSVFWEDPEANLSLFDNHLSKIIIGSSDLIVLPEMFSTGYSMNNKLLCESMSGRTITWMALKAKEKNCVITGSVIISENSHYYNRLIWMKPDGRYEHYDKKHLFRFANEQDFYSAGTKKIIVELNGWKICPLICYDLRFPVWCRNKFNTQNPTPEMDYDLLLFVANWPERRNVPWKTLLMARAMENQCFVVGVNRIGSDGNNIVHSGDSAVINPKGEIISIIKAHEESVETISLSMSDLESWRKAFPAWMDGDEFRILSKS